jgi:hypothetical protein
MDRQRSAFAHSAYEPAALVLVDAVDADGSDNSKLHCERCVESSVYKF